MDITDAGLGEVRGVCTHLVPGVDIRELAAIKAEGFNVISQPLYWNLTNQEPGKYDFSEYDVLASECRRLGLKVLWVVCFGNNYLYPAPDDKIPPRPDDQQWREWLKIVGVRYGDLAFAWCILKEPNRSWAFKPRPNAALYVEIVKTARACLPGYIIAGALSNKAGTADLDWEFIDSMLALNVMDHADYFGLDPYGNIDQREADMLRLQEKIAPGRDEVPRICWVEMGHSREWGGDQAVELDKAQEVADRLGIAMMRYCWFNRWAPNPVEAGFSIKPMKGAS